MVEEDIAVVAGEETKAEAEDAINRVKNTRRRNLLTNP